MLIRRGELNKGSGGQQLFGHRLLFPFMMSLKGDSPQDLWEVLGKVTSLFEGESGPKADAESALKIASHSLETLHVRVWP